MLDPERWVLVASLDVYIHEVRGSGVGTCADWISIHRRSVHVSVLGAFVDGLEQDEGHLRVELEGLGFGETASLGVPACTFEVQTTNHGTIECGGRGEVLFGVGEHGTLPGQGVETRPSDLARVHLLYCGQVTQRIHESTEPHDARETDLGPASELVDSTTEISHPSTQGQDGGVH